MSSTIEDLKRELAKDFFKNLSPHEQQETLRSLPPEKQQELLELMPLESLPPEKRLAGLSLEQIRAYLDQLHVGRRSSSRKPRRKK